MRGIRIRANTVTAWGTGYDSIWWAVHATFTATSNGTARIILAKYDTTGALLWDDVELVNGANVTSGLKMRYYPYGQEVGTATANDVAKFGTYTRDARSGLDYAMNRYYQSWWGRFTTADPYRASGGPGDPGSWNRYSYVLGDPVNYGDPHGLFAMPIDPPEWFSEPTPLNILFAAAIGRAMIAVQDRDDCYSALNAKDQLSALKRISAKGSA